MPFRAFFENPQVYPNRFGFYKQGGSPALLNQLMAAIDAHRQETEAVYLSWYLYNNRLLHDYLKRLSQEGVAVYVVTIPLEGYDRSSPRQLTDLDTGKVSAQKVTKYDLARELFAEIYRAKGFPNFRFFVFPHQYVRSKYVKCFARGTLPYSLHLKSAYIKRKTGYTLLLSSSNLAVRDLVKYESLVTIEDEPHYATPFQGFYQTLIGNSLSLRDYGAIRNAGQQRFEMVKPRQQQNCSISAPFYYNSAEQLETSLINLVRSARDRIIICAQHLAAFQYSINTDYHSGGSQKLGNRPGLLGAVLEKARGGIPITCLSQTFCHQGTAAPEGHRFRKPLNSKNFQRFYSALSSSRHAAYFVNEHLHSKFIIVDQVLVYCTYNFTPTQFTYLDQVCIPAFIQKPELSYYGIHCEVAAHVLITDAHTIAQFLQHTEMIKNDVDTVKVL